MSNYKRIYPMVDVSNIYISELKYDSAFESILYDGVSLKNMKPPRAKLKNLSGSALDLLYSLGGKLIVSEKTKTFLELLEENRFFEFIKVAFENKKMDNYYVLNILDLVDAFDWERSNYELFDELGPKGDKVIQNLIKMEINEPQTNKRGIFKMLNFEGDIFIHDDLANKMIENGITGLLLDPLVGHQIKK